MWPSISRVWPVMSLIRVFRDLPGEIHGAVSRFRRDVRRRDDEMTAMLSPVREGIEYGPKCAAYILILCSACIFSEKEIRGDGDLVIGQKRERVAGVRHLDARHRLSLLDHFAARFHATENLSFPRT